MAKLVPYDIWKERVEDSIHFKTILKIVSKCINGSTMPKHLSTDYYFHEGLREDIVKYIYKHSSDSRNATH